MVRLLAAECPRNTRHVGRHRRGRDRPLEPTDSGLATNICLRIYASQRRRELGSFEWTRRVNCERLGRDFKHLRAMQHERFNETAAYGMAILTHTMIRSQQQADAFQSWRMTKLWLW